MAQISDVDLAAMRRKAAARFPVVNYHKDRANAVFQAVEDWEVGGHTVAPGQSRQAAMEAAAGVNLTLAQETAFWEIWATWKAGRI